jgi:hypothetical protein
LQEIERLQKDLDEAKALAERRRVAYFKLTGQPVPAAEGE